MVGREPILRVLFLLALLAVVIIGANSALRPPTGPSPTVGSIERELATAVATKLLSQGYIETPRVSCAPPPGAGPPGAIPLNLVCQVTAVDKRQPSKTPVWFEDVTCGLQVPPGTPTCGSSGGDALQ